jgi:acyl carrier protein
VGAAAVMVVEVSPGDKRLVAYVEAEAEVVAGLRSYLRERLPDYMIPAAFVALPALPLTANGKVDREALPQPEWGEERGSAFVAPETPVQQRLSAIWGEVLGVERVGLLDDFFELGGHSLLATQVVSRVREEFGVDLPLPALFDEPTVAGLASRVEQLVSPIEGVERDGAQVEPWREQERQLDEARSGLFKSVRRRSAVSGRRV